jgi:RNA polymerase subunit RPABC4/transcription elongation factor Spt4
VGQTVGEIFRVDGTSYMYKVQITLGDVYQVQVENKANYYYWFSYIRVNNHVSGNFDLKRAPYNFFEILPAGFVLIAIGLLIIPSVAYLEHRARQEAKLLYQCQRCGKTVRIGMEKCPYCKIDLTKYWTTCKYCGKFYDSHLERCPKCGAETR